MTDDQTIASALATAERVARNVIPELAGKPLYIIQPEAGAMLTRQMLGYHRGCYFRGLDRALEPQLRTSGVWRGPGVAIAVDAFACFANELNHDAGLRRVVGIVLHELAHWLDREESLAEEKPEPYRRLVSACEELNNPPDATAMFAPVFLNHNDSFTRICAHLWYRARTFGGMILQARHLTFGSDYTGLEMLHTPQMYINALWPELVALREHPLRQISETPEPPPFTALWDEVIEKLIAARKAA